MVNKFFGSFHEQLEKTSGCPVDFIIQRNFDEFVSALFRREHTLAILPGPYFNVFKQLDYSAVASQLSEGKREVLVIAKKKRQWNGLADLIGHKVLVNSPLSASGSFFLDSVKKQTLLKKIKIEHRNSYDNMIFSVLKGDADAAVIIAEYWGALDKGIRNEHLSIIARLEIQASTEFVVLKEREYLIPVIYGALNSGTIKWGKPNDQALGPEPLEQLLQKKLQQFQQNQ
ncbi:MAG: PhnD/SsuA/transferrin family substrate-binding protein [Bermanella sp.]